MIKISIVFIISVALAAASQMNTDYLRQNGHPYRFRDDLPFALLAIVLILFAGLRTSYNDTEVYMAAFRRAKGVAAFLSDPNHLAIGENPLFYLLFNLLREFTAEPQVMIFLTSVFVQICYLRFIKLYSDNFLLSVVIYFALGTFATTLAIIKQSMAVAVFTLGFRFLLEKKWIRYYLTVLIAMGFHSFALVFAVLPLFARKPWGVFTFAFMGCAFLVLQNFQDALVEFSTQADNLGLDVSMTEMTHEHTVNPLRVAVYAVTPLFSLFFARYINRENTGVDNMLIHMSIISLAAMMMGTQSGANIFARMAHYFELGTVCCLPGMLKKPFVVSSHRLIVTIAILCFMGFFAYGSKGFDEQYMAIGLLGMF